jgi:hypothetical protein
VVGEDLVVERVFYIYEASKAIKLNINLPYDPSISLLGVYKDT